MSERDVLEKAGGGFSDIDELIGGTAAKSGIPDADRPDEDIVAGSQNAPSGFYTRTQERHDSGEMPLVLPPGQLVRPWPPEDQRADILLPYKRLRDFVMDFLNAHPDESFCFLDRGKLREKARILSRHFIPDDPRRKVAYAVKANPRNSIIHTLAEEGIGDFDCASIEEIKRVRKVCPDAWILFNNPVKSASAIRVASGMNVRHYTAQTPLEVQKISQNIWPPEEISNTEIVSRLKTSNDFAAIDLSSKFGAPPEEVVRMIRLIRDRIGATAGISIHAGTQNVSGQSFADAIRLMGEVAERAGGVDIFNVGGGIPVNYSSSDKYDFKDYVEVISRAINTYLVDVLKGRSGSKEQMIAIEPGRAIVAEAVDLIIPIMAVEEGDNPAVYFNDGIYTSFIDHAVHKWTYNFETMRKDGLPHRGRKKLYTLFGRTCDSGDTLGEVMLPEDIREGDYIWVSSAGAYMDSLANPFHDFKPPKYIIYN